MKSRYRVIGLILFLFLELGGERGKPLVLCINNTSLLFVFDILDSRVISPKFFILHSHSFTPSFVLLAMVSKLDSSVGQVVQALQKNSMLEDSIIVFISDNGAPTVGLMRNHGSNWPLKGVSCLQYVFVTVMR